jgi:[CysO sulfur-carrier protein]-S-L-cysteine hydrolase
MKISQALIDEMIAHAREDAPNECCGLVGGKEDRATRVFRAHNAFESPLRYSIASDDLFRIQEREMRNTDEEVVGIYHSHTKSAPYPSQTDLNEAVAWPEPVYFIVSLQDADAPVVKGFLLRDMKIAEVELEIG